MTTTNPGPPPPADLASDAVQADLRTAMASVRQMGRFLVTTLQVNNPDSAPATFAYNNAVTAQAAKNQPVPR